MKSGIKWIAIIILMPIIVAIEVYKTLKEAGVEIPDPENTLKDLKQSLKDA